MPDVINNVTVTLDDLGHELAECLEAMNREDFQTLSFERFHKEANTLVRLRLKPRDLKLLREFSGSAKITTLREAFGFKKIHMEEGIRQEAPWELFGRQLNVYYNLTDSVEQVIFWDKEHYDRKFAGTMYH